MSAARNKDPTWLPGVVLVPFGAVFAGMGVWSLLQAQPSPDAVPGWPFAIMGSVFFCLGWALLMRGRALLALTPVCLLCLVAIGAGISIVWREHQTVATYRPVDGWVLTATVRPPTVLYQYEIAGRTFTSNRIYPRSCLLIDPLETQDSVQQVIKRVAPDLPEGVARMGQVSAEADRTKAYKVKAYYNPREPADAFLIKRYSSSPFPGILSAVALLLFAGLGVVAQSALSNRGQRVGRCLVAGAWHLVGLLACGYCLLLFMGGAVLGLVPMGVIMLYEVLGLVPLIVALPTDGWPGRVRSALGSGCTFGVVTCLFGLPVAAAVSAAVALFVAPLVSWKLPNLVVWVLAAVPAVACAAGVATAVVQLLRGRAGKHR